MTLPPVESVAAPASAAPASAAPSPPPPSAIEVELDRLRSISVAVRLPDVAKKAPGCRIGLAALEEAIERASADMFVHYVANGAEMAACDYMLLGGGALVYHLPFRDEEMPRNVPELAKFANVGPALVSKGERFLLWVTAGGYTVLADRAPGLVWEVVDKTAIFVPLDGDGYQVELDAREKRPTIERGAGDVDRWPPPVPNPGFSPAAMQAQARKIGPRAYAADEAFAACAREASKRVDELVDRMAEKGSTGDRQLDAWITKYYAEEEHWEAYVKQLYVRRTCKKHIEAWQRAYAESIAASVKERRAVYDKGKARISALRE